MKANELRIGNFYKNERGFDCVFTYDDFLPMLRGEIKIEPIPITSKWLEKFGFENHHRANYELGKFVVVHSWDWGDKEAGTYTPEHVWYDEHTQKIFYVHTFQNLYHSLTGKELTIKKNATES